MALKSVALYSHCVLNSFMYFESTSAASGDQANFLSFSGATGSLVGLAFLFAVFCLFLFGRRLVEGVEEIGSAEV